MNGVNVGLDIQQIQPPPVYTCHKCEMAKILKFHYLQSTTKSVTVSQTLTHTPR